MKKISLILLGVFGLLFTSNVKAEDTDQVWRNAVGQYLGPTVYSVDNYSYSNFNQGSNTHLLERTGTPLGTWFGIYVEPLASLTNKYHFSGTIYINFDNMPSIIPYQDSNYLNSCLYLAQNAYDSKHYLAKCMSYDFTSDMPFSNLQVSVTAADSLSVTTSDNGVVTVLRGEHGIQFVVNYSFDVTFTQAAHQYYFNFISFVTGGYLFADDKDVVNVIMTTPKITSIPYFSAENSLFGSFFNNLNFNVHGLTSIVTYPVGFFNAMSSNDPNSSLNISLFNKSFNLKNGIQLFWGRNDVSTFRTFWNMFFGGLILYFLYLRLFKTVKNTLTPENDEVKYL